MVAGAFAFSAMTAAVKFAGSGVPLFQIVVIRTLVVTVLSAIWVHRGGHGFRPKEPGRVALRAMFGFATLNCYFYAVIHLPLADATVIYFIHPVLTAIAAAVVLGERMGWREVASVALSLVGVIIVARPGFLAPATGGLDPFAVGIAVTAAVFSTGSWVTIRSIRHDPPILIVFYFSLLTVVLAFPMMLVDMVRPSPAQWTAILLAGVATHVAQLSFTWGLRLERAGRATAVSYVQIVFAALLGWILFAEVPDGWTALGAAVIVGSTFRLMRGKAVPRGPVVPTLTVPRD